MRTKGCLNSGLITKYAFKVNEVLRGKRSTPYFQPARPLTENYDQIVADYYLTLGDEVNT